MVEQVLRVDLGSKRKSGSLHMTCPEKNDRLECINWFDISNQGLARWQVATGDWFLGVSAQLPFQGSAAFCDTGARLSEVTITTSWTLLVNLASRAALLYYLLFTYHSPLKIFDNTLLCSTSYVHYLPKIKLCRSYETG